jgi:hypothetical protein
VAEPTLAGLESFLNKVYGFEIEIR